MSTHYQNYNRLKKIMGAEQENFTEVLSKFLANLREFNDNIRNFKDEQNFNNTWLKKDDFLSKMKRLTNLPELRGKHPNSIKNDDFVKTYVEHYDRYKKFPKVRVTFTKFSRTIDDPYRRSRLEKTLDNIDPNLQITPYDEELHKFEYILDEYV